jgi:hypothetical protein
VSLLQEMEDSCYWENEEIFEQVGLSLSVVEGKSGKTRSERAVPLIHPKYLNRGCLSCRLYP